MPGKLSQKNKKGELFIETQTVYVFIYSVNQKSSPYNFFCGIDEPV